MPVIDYDTDPYADVREQTQEVSTYSVTSVRIFLLLPLALAISSIVDTSLRSGRVLVPLVVISAVVGLALVSFQISRVTLDTSGILLRYWLLPNKHIPWPAICQLTIKNTITGQATAAIALCGSTRRRAVLTLFVGYLPQVRSDRGVDTLIKTVIVRANLTDMKRSGWGSVTYNRAEANN